MLNFPLLRKENTMRTINSPELKQQITNWGAALVGFGDVSIGLAEELRHMPNAISIAVPHPRYKGTYKCGPVTAYSNQHEEVDRVLETVQKKTVTFLKAQGWRTLAIPPDSAKPDGAFVAKLYPLFPHKTAATCAGLGWIGKSGLLVSPEYGARLSWATVLTDAPLEVSQTPYLESKCGKCQRCVNACPAMAIRNLHWQRENEARPFIDINACAEYMTYTVKIFNKYICGLCMLSCPMGNPKKC